VAGLVWMLIMLHGGMLTGITGCAHVADSRLYRLGRDHEDQ